MLGSVPDFTLTNQIGEKVSLETFRGQIWLADIIFTICPGPCAKMSRLMSEFQTALPPKSAVKLVSLTTYPEHDTPEVLNRYGQLFNANPAQWTLLTGPKKEIYDLAVSGLKLALEEKKPEERESPQDLFVHSTLVALVDKRGKLRGAFESLEPDSKQKILSAVSALLREE
jgi:protein SCO1/2